MAVTVLFYVENWTSAKLRGGLPPSAYNLFPTNPINLVPDPKGDWLCRALGATRQFSAIQAAPYRVCSPTRALGALARFHMEKTMFAK